MNTAIRLLQLWRTCPRSLQQVLTVNTALIVLQIVKGFVPQSIDVGLDITFSLVVGCFCVSLYRQALQKLHAHHPPDRP